MSGQRGARQFSTYADLDILGEKMSLVPWFGLTLSTMAAMIAAIEKIKVTRNKSKKKFFSVFWNDRWAKWIAGLAILGAVTSGFGIVDQVAAEHKLAEERSETLIAAMGDTPN